MSVNQFIVSSSPHIRSPISTAVIMRDVIFALLPASFAGVYFFGPHALAVIVTGVATAVISEAIIEKLTHRPVTVGDFSAAVTGLLLALTLPPDLPLWIVAVGAIVAIGLGKQVFGGLGHNPFNPALIGRAVLLASWPVAMTTWRWPITEAPWFGQDFDVLTSATPLAAMKLSGVKTPYLPLFFGSVAGSIGETSAVAILLGAAFLLLRGHITWRIPGFYILTVAILSILFGQDPIFHILAGGLLLGAFFMATDYVSTPVTPLGQAIFGIGCGALTVLIRLYGGYPEGVCYSILIMDAATALIDRFTRPRRFGEVKHSA
ncbi:MAG TPA: RnfABCDGE type electron transport complex subunit D [Firmicutes bacterium]|nr:RnfABCDGE type electron transport complex subunit D [Bacillota bacterium]